MTERAAVLAALTAHANKPATSRDIRSQPGEVLAQPAFVQLNQFLRALASRQELDAMQRAAASRNLNDLPELTAREELDLLIADVAALIRAADPFRGSSIAINCGTLVEMGGNPDLVFPHLLAELPRHLSLARRAHERTDTSPGAMFDDDPDAAKASAGLMFLLLATMTVICRKVEYRQALRANPAVVEGIAALRQHSQEADFVAQVLALTDNMELLVLVPEEQKGFRVALEAINNNFHLFTLLQANLIGGGHLDGEPTAPAVLGVATGEAPQQFAQTDHARWHFYTWAGLNPDGTFAATDLTIWIPGEAAPADIPAFDGTRVMLIGPPVLASREWNSNEFVAIHDALRSRAEIVEVLPTEQVELWLARIKQARLSHEPEA